MLLRIGWVDIMKKIKKRQVIDFSLRSITYLASLVSVVILGAILIYVFSYGSRLFSFKLITTDYHAQPYRLKTDENVANTFDNPNIDDAFFSENFGFAVKDDITLEGLKTIRFVYIDTNSPLNNMTNEQDELQAIEKDFIFDSTMRAVLPDGSTKTVFSKDGAEAMVLTLNDAVAISAANVKFEGGGIRGSIITTLYLIVLT